MAQGGNFGIGLTSANANDNVVEDNIVLGNTNGIILVAGALRNTFRRNLVVGNPPTQLALDYPSANFADVRNLSGSDTNVFQANICLTSVNAPCPAIGPPSLTAKPNPIPVTGVLGTTTITWMAPGTEAVEVRIGSPDGRLFVTGGDRGSAQTGAWVSDGMTFYLQDVTGGKPLTADNTLATLVIHLQRRSAVNFPHRGGPRPWPLSVSSWSVPAILLGLVLCRKRVRMAWGAFLLCAVGFAQQSDAKLEKMVAQGAGPKELAQYLFDAHACKTCHTTGQDGKLGFTQKGKERAQGFEGCTSTLKAMSVIAKVPETQRSATQRQRAQRFEEFGCATCHKIGSGKMELTLVGAKLAHLHLGCVQVEKLLATARASQR